MGVQYGNLCVAPSLIISKSHDAIYVEENNELQNNTNIFLNSISINVIMEKVETLKLKNSLKFIMKRKLVQRPIT